MMAFILRWFSPFSHIEPIFIAISSLFSIISLIRHFFIFISLIFSSIICFHWLRRHIITIFTYAAITAFAISFRYAYHFHFELSPFSCRRLFSAAFDAISWYYAGCHYFHADFAMPLSPAIFDCHFRASSLIFSFRHCHYYAFSLRWFYSFHIIGLASSLLFIDARLRFRIFPILHFIDYHYFIDAAFITLSFLRYFAPEPAFFAFAITLRRWLPPHAAFRALSWLSPFSIYYFHFRYFRLLWPLRFRHFIFAFSHCCFRLSFSRFSLLLFINIAFISLFRHFSFLLHFASFHFRQLSPLISYVDWLFQPISFHYAIDYRRYASLSFSLFSPLPLFSPWFSIFFRFAAIIAIFTFAISRASILFSLMPDFAFAAITPMPIFDYASHCRFDYCRRRWFLRFHYVFAILLIVFRCFRFIRFAIIFATQLFSSALFSRLHFFHWWLYFLSLLLRFAI